MIGSDIPGCSKSVLRTCDNRDFSYTYVLENKLNTLYSFTIMVIKMKFTRYLYNEDEVVLTFLEQLLKQEFERVLFLDIRIL